MEEIIYLRIPPQIQGKDFDEVRASLIYFRGDRLLSRESQKGIHFIDVLFPEIFAHKNFISHCHLCYLV